MLRQRNGLSDSLLCESKTKTKAQRVPTKQWKYPVPTTPPDGTGGFLQTQYG